MVGDVVRRGLGLAGLGITAFLIAWVLSIAPAAAATLIGKQLTVGYYYPDTSTLLSSATPNPQTFTIGSDSDPVFNVENFLRITVSVGADSIAVKYFKIGEYTNTGWGSAAFNGLVFDLQGGGSLGFAGIDVTPQPAMQGFDDSRAAISDTRITLNWQGLQYDNGGGSEVLAVQAKLTPVPVPAALPLLASGLAMLGVVARRRRRQQLAS